MRFLCLLLCLACAQSSVELGPLVIPPREDPVRWEGDIQALIQERKSVDNAVVFLGSSSIRLWSSLEADMAPMPVVNFGFGGSKIFDSIYWLETLLEGLEPQALVVFAGTNDISGNQPRPAEWIGEQFDALVARLRVLGHDVPLIYIAISPTPARAEHISLVLETNRRIASKCAKDEQLFFVDTASALLDSEGRPNPKWFVADRLHLNVDGYASWASRIRPVLEQALAPRQHAIHLSQEPEVSEVQPLDVVAPVKADGAFRVLQFNVWQEGTSVEGGFDKIVEVILASNADAIALSEVRNYEGKDFHEHLIAALAERGAHYQGKFAGGDVGLLTRWKIEKAEAAADDTASDRGSVMAYHLRGPEGQELVICPAHLDYRNYAVYLPRGYDGNSFQMIDKDGDGEPDPITKESELHRMDKASARDEAHEAFLAYVKKQKLKHTPVLYVGDFNECSHLDWTHATKDLYSHNGVVIEWKHSKMLHKAGFRDAWRELYPDPVTHPGATWPSEAYGRGSTSWAPKVDERDRIDFVYHNGQDIRATAAWIVGSRKYYVFNELAQPKTEDPFALTDLPWPSDHKGVMVDFVFE